MTVLVIGSKGPLVKAWELFLCGQGYLISREVDQVYTEVTADATSLFQAKQNLVVDGTADEKTQAAAAKLGFNPSVDDIQLTAPAGVLPLSYMDRQQVLGSIVSVPAPTATNPEGIRIINGWQGKYLARLNIPQLRGVRGAAPNGDIFWNKNATQQVVDLFAAWEKAGLMKHVLSWAGSWVPRYVRGSRSTLSNHSWGSAFDINAAWNGLGCTPAAEGARGSVRELVPLALDYGFYWGGYGWPKQGSVPRRDGMHFEVREVLKS